MQNKQDYDHSSDKQAGLILMMLASLFYYGLTALSCVYCWGFKDRLHDMQEYVQHLPSTNLTEFESQVVGRTIGYAYYCFVGSIVAATVHLLSSVYWCLMYRSVKTAVNQQEGAIQPLTQKENSTTPGGGVDDDGANAGCCKTLGMRTVLLLLVVQPYLWGLTFPCFAYVCYDFAYNVNIFMHLEHAVFDAQRDDLFSLLNEASTFFWASICTLATLLFQIVLGHIWAIQRTNKMPAKKMCCG